MVALYWEIFTLYLRLGCVSFGGPVAHLGYFREAFVVRQKWLSDEAFSELIALCQFIPGPSSSQLGFAIAWKRSGLVGASIAWLGFTLPSAMLMIGFAYGLWAIGPEFESVRRGLLIATVAVVANAVWSLGKQLCPDAPRLLIALVAAVCIYFIPTNGVSIMLIALAGFVGSRIAGRKDASAAAPDPSARRFEVASLRSGSLALVLFGFLLLGAFVVPQKGWIGLLATHYQAGALVFGGGHVVLPLLHDGIVGGGYATDSVFLSGYSAAQVLPGPLFTFSAFLGTVGAGTETFQWLGGVAAVLAIFLPGMLLFLGVYPLWNQLRDIPWARGVLWGTNAAVVGLLAAAFIHPVWSHGIRTPLDVGLALLAFVLIARFRVPVWAVIPLYGAMGFFL